MGRDDYYTIVAKILVFLYKKLKGKDKHDVKDYVLPMTKDFPISEDYMLYVLEKMTEQGFVENVFITKGMGGVVVNIDYEDMRITPAGIDYMLENTTIRKVIGGLKEAAEISSLFSLI